MSDSSSLHAHLPSCSLNTEHTEIHSNVEAALKRQLPQCTAYETQQDAELIVLGGGWSLAETMFDIHGLVKKGAKIVTLNGTHQWAIDHNLKPSAHIMLDARETNARFVKNPVRTCQYLIASQCHPAVFDALEDYNAWIWHSVSTPEEKEILDKFYLGRWTPIVGGSTVMLRGLSLLRLLGFRRFHVFGFDSCCHPKTKAHHSYIQPENDKADMIRFDHGGKTWVCHTWMASQALDFLNQYKALGQDWDIKVYGNGLISHLLKED